MTKYVLNSGNIRGDQNKARKYTAEVVESLGDKPKILFCFFANPREDWEGNYRNYLKDMPNFFPEGVSPDFDMANPEKFEEQCEWADAIWLRGGDDHLVMYWLRQFDLKKIWDGKVLALSSASSNAVVSSFWTCDWRQCFAGMGLLPIKFISHYKSNYGSDDLRGPIDWEKAKSELENYGETGLPVVAIPEGNYVVYEL